MQILDYLYQVELLICAHSKFEIKATFTFILTSTLEVVGFIGGLKTKSNDEY